MFRSIFQQNLLTELFVSHLKCLLKAFEFHFSGSIGNVVCFWFASFIFGCSIKTNIVFEYTSLPSSLAFLAARRCRTTFLKITAAASTALCISASPNVVLCCKNKKVKNMRKKKRKTHTTNQNH